MPSKLEKFADIASFGNCFNLYFENIPKGFDKKGKWLEGYFQNNNPLVLELGCGKGEYSVGLAAQFPEKNFVGIDLKGARFWRGAKTAVDDGLDNVAFVRTQIELIDYIFDANEVDEIWIA